MINTQLERLTDYQISLQQTLAGILDDNTSQKEKNELFFKGLIHGAGKIEQLYQKTEQQKQEIKQQNITIQNQNFIIQRQSIQMQHLLNANEELEGRVEYLEVTNQRSDNQKKCFKKQVDKLQDELHVEKEKEKYLNDLKNTSNFINYFHKAVIFGAPLVDRKAILISIVMSGSYFITRNWGANEVEKFLKIEKKYLAKHPNCLKSEAFEYAKTQYEMLKSQYEVQESPPL